MTPERKALAVRLRAIVERWYGGADMRISNAIAHDLDEAADALSVDTREEARPTEPGDACEGWEREYADVDRLLAALGLDPQRCRTDSGWLNVPHTLALLAARPSAEEAQPVAQEPIDLFELRCALKRLQAIGADESECEAVQAALDLARSTAEATPPARDDMREGADVLIVAKELCRQHAEVCNVDAGDAWTVYSEDFYENARRIVRELKK